MCFTASLCASLPHCVFPCFTAQKSVKVSAPKKRKTRSVTSSSVKTGKKTKKDKEEKTETETTKTNEKTGGKTKVTQSTRSCRCPVCYWLLTGAAKVFRHKRHLQWQCPSCMAMLQYGDGVKVTFVREKHKLFLPSYKNRGDKLRKNDRVRVMFKNPKEQHDGWLYKDPLKKRKRGATTYYVTFSGM